MILSKIVLVIALLLVGLVSMSYFTDRPLPALFNGKKAEAPVPQPPKPASTTAPSGPVVAAGRVEPAEEEISIGSEMEGRLARVFVKEGDRVSPGTLLAQLINDDYRARVELAKAQVAERSAALLRLKNGSTPEDRALAEARLREEQSRWESARHEVARRRPLVEHGAVSRMEFDLAVREETTALARVDAAKEQLAIVRAPSRQEDIQRATAELAAAAARPRKENE